MRSRQVDYADPFCCQSVRGVRGRAATDIRTVLLCPRPQYVNHPILYGAANTSSPSLHLFFHVIVSAKDYHDYSH
jgi:hypothetical protein